MHYTGKIISLAFPDTFVRFSDEKVSQLLPWFGLGKKGVIKAGHAAFILVNNQTGKAMYYDFGRYITPQGYGRVRSEITDVELEIPFRADVNVQGELVNLDKFLLWLEANPQKTHGSGKLVASVCNYIDYNKAYIFISNEQAKGSIPYHTFAREGSNCSRIVTDTILAATDKSEIRKPLLRNKMFTPSPLGNVEKASYGSPIYQVEKGIISNYDRSGLKETLQNVFQRKVPSLAENIDKAITEQLKKAQLLVGIGSSAYFRINKDWGNGLFEISRFNELGEEDFRGIFQTKKGLNINAAYKFVYDSHCKHCHIKQGARIFKLELQKRVMITELHPEENINSKQMEYLT